MIGLRGFARRTDGAASVEAVLVLPVLLVGMLLPVVGWDAYRTMTAMSKSAYVMADHVTRQRRVDDGFLDDLGAYAGFVANSQAGRSMRVSAIRATSATDRTVDWSHGIGGLGPRTGAGDLSARLPAMDPDEQLIVVEVAQDWVPFGQVGLSAMSFAETAVARPRFAAMIEKID